MVTASAVSLVLPVLVFLWAMLSIPRPSKRFWMTAIVFTEVAVVTKYLFQFGFFPWNSQAVLRRYENKPYFPPRILGLEKADGYIKYDLLQLMALFFHRMGGLIILFLVAIIWFPLLFMSLVRSVVGVVNQPIDVTVTLKLGGYEPLFTMSAQQPSIQPFTQAAYDELSRHFDPNPLAMQFISQYGPEDIVTAHIEGSSGALWRISPPSRAQMKRELYNGTAGITLRFTWNFQRCVGRGAA
ncbi:PREDICTED: piezo-type mechanosensitive ion channel component 1-like, partial [Condylura cristata]|uniref:piezo-type mechanosensitive ion channel component 1-like n=1 Tax=Condylura cristata TaxID=143302 RepID=UPI000642F605